MNERNASPGNQDSLYARAAAEFGGALARLAAGTERDPSSQHDLLQEIHMALWRSFAVYQGQCSLRTWTYRVAHNAAASHVKRSIRFRRNELMSLEELERVAPTVEAGAVEDEQSLRDRLQELIRQLKPIDRDVMLLYLEGVDAQGIGEVLGLSTANVFQKIHRSKALLRKRFEK